MADVHPATLDALSKPGLTVVPMPLAAFTPAQRRLVLALLEATTSQARAQAAADGTGKSEKAQKDGARAVAP